MEECFQFWRKRVCWVCWYIVCLAVFCSYVFLLKSVFLAKSSFVSQTSGRITHWWSFLFIWNLFEARVDVCGFQETKREKCDDFYQEFRILLFNRVKQYHVQGLALRWKLEKVEAGLLNDKRCLVKLKVLECGIWKAWGPEDSRQDGLKKVTLTILNRYASHLELVQEKPNVATECYTNLDTACRTSLRRSCYPRRFQLKTG